MAAERATKTVKPSRSLAGTSVPADEWALTDAHQHSTYSCGRCGKKFPNPDALYMHLDKKHGSEEVGR